MATPSASAAERARRACDFGATRYQPHARAASATPANSAVSPTGAGHVIRRSTWARTAPHRAEIGRAQRRPSVAPVLAPSTAKPITPQASGWAPTAAIPAALSHDHRGARDAKNATRAPTAIRKAMSMPPIPVGAPGAQAAARAEHPTTTATP